METARSKASSRSKVGKTLPSERSLTSTTMCWRRIKTPRDSMFESIDRTQGPNWKLRLLSASLVIALAAGAIWVIRMTQMPLRSYALPLPPLSSEQAEIRDRLAVHVKYLSQTIGERNLSRPGSLSVSVDYLRRNLQQAG